MKPNEPQSHVEPSPQLPAKVTLSWLFTHLDVRVWLTIAGIVASAIYLGIAIGKSPLVSAPSQTVPAAPKVEQTFVSSKAQLVTKNCTSSTLIGTVYPDGTETQAWFEWGTSPDHFSKTPPRTFKTTSDLSYTISGLAENTTYYFRLAGANPYGTFFAETREFKTRRC